MKCSCREKQPVIIAAKDYLSSHQRHHLLAPGETKKDSWAIAESGHWYDLEVTAGTSAWRFAGHAETGHASVSDPALGRG